MKESKSAASKIPENSALIDETTAAKKEIELLKKKLKESKKKYNDERKKNKYWFDHVSSLQIKIFKAQEKIKLIEAQGCRLIDMINQSDERYCDILTASRSNNISDLTIDIESHRKQFKNIINTLSLIADSKKSDLLKYRNLEEFLENQN